MHPSPSALASIRLFVGDWTPSDAAIAVALNAPAIANPSPQPTVAKPYTVADLSARITPQVMGALLACPSFPTILGDVNSNNVPACNLWVSTLYASGVITQEQEAGLLGVVNGTELDPAWPAQISWAQANLGRAVDAADIAEARPNS